MKALVAVVLMSASAQAFANDLTVGTPTFVQQMQVGNGNQELFLDFCLIGQHICEEQQAIAFGDICEEGLAADIGERQSGDLAGGAPPPGFHYAGWRCGKSGKYHVGRSSASLRAEAMSEDPDYPIFDDRWGKPCTGGNLFEKGCARWSDKTSGILLAVCDWHRKDETCGSETLTPEGFAFERKLDASLPECPPNPPGVSGFVMPDYSCKFSHVVATPVQSGFAN